MLEEAFHAKQAEDRQVVLKARFYNKRTTWNEKTNDVYPNPTCAADTYRLLSSFRSWYVGAKARFRVCSPSIATKELRGAFCRNVISLTAMMHLVP